MKRTTLAALALSATLALGACGQEVATPASQPSATQQATTATSAADTQQTSTAQDAATAQATSTEPAATQSSTAQAGTTGAAVAPLTQANLPTAGDLEYHKAGDWKLVNAGPGQGHSALTICQGKLPGLENPHVFRADFTMPVEGGTDGYAAAMVIEYKDNATAQEARKTVLSWGKGKCETGPDGEPTDVKAYGGDAAFSEMTAKANGDNTRFVSIGAVVVNNRLAIVTMEDIGQDSNWDYAPNGEVGAMHPMFRTLPKVADRLAK